MSDSPDHGQVRLAELVASLSLGIDLGFGQPMEHVLRQCLIALRLAERLGADDESRSVVYYTALLVNVGCHTDAHEQAKWFGDDIALKSGKYDHEFRSVGAAAAAIRRIGAGNPPLHRIRVGLEFALTGRHDVDGMIATHAALASSLAAQLGLARRSWRRSARRTSAGTGEAGRTVLKGEAIPLAARIAQFAEFVEVAHRVGGVEAATSLARKRSGKQFDPEPGRAPLRGPRGILGGLDAVGTWDAVIEAEPALAVVLSGAQFDAALEAIANFIDLKSPYTLGHSRAVADLAAAAAAQLGLPERDVTTLRRAGLVHDFGRLGVSNAIWDKRGPLGAGEWERVRMHPYLTERMLHASPTLAPLGAVAVQHPRAARRVRVSARALRSGDLAPGADPGRSRRLPGDARDEAVPSGRTPDEAAAELRAEAGAGRLDPEAVDAVLAAAGHRVPRRREGPAGSDGTRGRGAAARRPGSLEQGDRRAARDLAEDGRKPRRAHLREDQRLEPGRRETVRRAARLASRRRQRREPSGRKMRRTPRVLPHASV